MCDVSSQRPDLCTCMVSGLSLILFCFPVTLFLPSTVPQCFHLSHGPDVTVGQLLTFIITIIFVTTQFADQKNITKIILQVQKSFSCSQENVNLCLLYVGTWIIHCYTDIFVAFWSIMLCVYVWRVVHIADDISGRRPTSVARVLAVYSIACVLGLVWSTGLFCSAACKLCFACIAAFQCLSKRMDCSAVLCICFQNISEKYIKCWVQHISYRIASCDVKFFGCMLRVQGSRWTLQSAQLDLRLVSFSTCYLSVL